MEDFRLSPTFPIQHWILQHENVGPFVTEPPKSTFLGGIEQVESLQSQVYEAGRNIKTEERFVSLTTAPEEWEKDYGDRFSASLARIETVQSVAGKRVANFDSYLPILYFDMKSLKEFDGTAIEYFNQHSEKMISHIRSGVFDIQADMTLAEKLRVKPKNATLHNKETYFDLDGNPVVISLNFFLAETFQFLCHPLGYSDPT